MTETKELLHSLVNAGEQPQNKEQSSEELHQLVERIPITGTPFHTVGNKEQGYFLTLGKYRVSDEFKTKEDLETYIHNENIQNHSWDLIMHLIFTILEYQKK